MPIPENAKAIYTFLTHAGFSDNAAAGILGNIEQESGGNPEAGTNPPGKGLIQKLGDPGGTLAHELQVLMEYVKANGSIADINAHSQTPAAAATYFSDKYERPGIPNIQNRISSANEVAAAAKSGKWPSSSAPSGGSNTGALAAGGSLGLQDSPLGGLEQLGSSALGIVTGTASTVGDIATSLQGIGRAINTAVKFLAVLGHPSFWLRLGAFLAGIISALIALYFLGKSIGFKAPSVMPIPV
jgi:hypothetical protein